MIALCLTVVMNISSNNSVAKYKQSFLNDLIFCDFHQMAVGQ
jgi:hypothetical protein